jgi:hypothetical protein
MKIRITGQPGEVTGVITALTNADSLDVIEVSDPYPNRGDSKMIRIYVEAQLHVHTAAKLRTRAEVTDRLSAGRDEDLRAADEHLRDEIRAHRGHRHRPGEQSQDR